MSSVVSVSFTQLPAVSCQFDIQNGASGLRETVLLPILQTTWYL